MRRFAKYIAIIAVILPLYRANAASNRDSIAAADTTIRSSAEPNSLFWISFGGGFLHNLLAADFKGTYAWDEYSSISMKVLGAAQLAIFGHPNEEVVEYGIYYGRYSCNYWGLVRIAAGPSFFRRYLDPTGYKNSFGIGAEAEAMVKLEVIGFSVMGTVMYSHKFLYAGIVFNINLGKLN